MKAFPLTFLMLVLGSPAIAEERVVAEFSGSEPGLTRPFQVEDGWELRWSAEARRFQITVLGTETQIPSIAVDQVEPGGGTRHYARGGRFQLDIDANGPWTVRILQGD